MPMPSSRLQQSAALPTHFRLGLVALSAAVLAGCSSVNNALSSDKVDYRNGGSSSAAPKLEVPPDLTQLSGSSRYQISGGTVSASAYAGATGTAAAGTAVATGTATQVAAQSAGPLHIERDGNQRWIVTTLTPEQVWPQIKNFWQEQGFTLAIEQAEIGVMETEWSENRAKLPKDAVRNAIGGFLNSLYDSGERDRFRTRLERTSKGTEIYISHRGVAEVLVGQTKESTTWQVRPSNPDLEAEMLSRLMVKLGAQAEAAKQELARTSATTAPAAPARARLAEGSATAVKVDDDFDRTWRRVGLALDRSGFTVEDRDRSQGTYFVRYVDPGNAKNDPGFLSKIFGSGKEGGNVARYRVKVVGQGQQSLVSVLDSQGKPESGKTGERIAKLLVDELK